MPDIELRNISKFICDDVNLKVRDREFLVLLGANGSGKTTLLNIIAGLIDYKGSVLYNGESVDRMPASRRLVSYLFQNLLLFPHLTVAGNIAYGLRTRNLPPEETTTRVNDLMRMMKIEHLAARHPKHLSGGEQQRTALARALAVSPEVLLLDEPLSSLDLQSAKYLRIELKQIHRKLGITTVYVTHDLQEAEEMADRIAVIQNGHVEQIGTPDEIFFSPASRSVSDFIGAPNILECDYCRSVGNGMVEVGCGGLPVFVPHTGNNLRKIAIFPHDIYISDSNPPGTDINRFQGTVTGIDTTHAAARIGIKTGNNNLMAEIPYHIYEGLNLAAGQEVYIILRFGRIRTYE
jgi:ABC-type Fe3+/spermidine/putrescine transport system ATPase subunit